MVAEVMRITNGNGARVAFDPIGGPTFPKLISALANQSIVYIYGALSEGDTPIRYWRWSPRWQPSGRTVSSNNPRRRP